jgi:predicted Fe-Mo cluster-binding NifX family protein
MKVAVASMGTVPEAWVGTKFGKCCQFLVFDLDTMEYVVVSVPPHPEGQVSLAAIRAVAEQGVAAVITGEIRNICRQTLLDLGIDVVDGVEGMTVGEAIDRYLVTGLQAIEERKGFSTRIAAVSFGQGGLDASLAADPDACTSFVVVDPKTNEWSLVQAEPGDSVQETHMATIRAVARSGATVLITPQVRPECCVALQALAIDVYVADAGLTVREAIARFEAGQLEQAVIGPCAGQ